MSEACDEVQADDGDPQDSLAAAHAQLARYAHDLRRLLERERDKSAELEAAHIDTLMRLTLAAECKDAATGAHLERMADYSRVLALRIGLSKELAERIGRAAPLHDVGKIGIPDTILTKPGYLDEEEWSIMRCHPEIGASLLTGSTSLLIETARTIALTHHEHWDGSGYPKGLRGKETPIEGRVVTLADCYDALRSARHYKRALDHESACKLILGGNERTRPSHFDPTLLAAFREIHAELGAIHERHSS